MSLFRRLELLHLPSSALLSDEACIYKPRSSILFPFSSFADDEAEEQLSNHFPHHFFLPLPAPHPLDFLVGAADLLQTERMAIASAIRRFQERAEAEFQLRSLSDRVAALEMGFDRVLNQNMEGRGRKYTWTTEIKRTEEEDGVDRKYKWTAEAKAGGEKKYEWKAEIKGKGKNAPISGTYTFQASTAPATEGKKTKKEEEKGKKGDKGSTARVVEISEPDQRALVLKRGFAKRTVNQRKATRKEISPQDAALIIQRSYRAHLVWRSRMLRELRDLAVAKAKLKELRSLFSNFSYRRRISSDAEEHQRFSEKIVVILLTVDAIEGSDYMIRAARRSMINELEAMLETVDPQQPGKLGSSKRRKFDLPEIGGSAKEMALGVAEVVQMLDQVDNRSNA